MNFCLHISRHIFLPGAYPRHLEPATLYHHLSYPYTMAIAKGSSFDGGDGVTASGGGATTKKPRTVFTPKQLLYLEEEFAGNQFPNMEQRKKMAITLDLTQQHIQIWFQNRRAKTRRKKKRYSEEEKMRKDPEPPPFWPSNLPFSSNLGGISIKSTNSTDSPESPTNEVTELDANGRGPSSGTPPQASPQDSHQPKDYTPPPTLSPSSFPPLNNSHTNNHHTHDSGRPPHLPCSTQDPPLKSPAQACTPGTSHSQLPTPPPPYAPTISHHSSVSNSTLMMSSHPGTSSEVDLAPPGGDLAMHNFPPLPPPESLMEGNYEEHANFLTSLAPPQVYDPVASLYAAARGGAGSLMLPPPPYSFGSSSSLTLSSTSSITLQTSYTPDHQHSRNLFITPQSLSSSSNRTTNSNLSNPRLLEPLPLTTDKTTTTTQGPSSLSPSTLSPLTNSDCSPSPITQDVSLPPPSTLPTEGNFSLAPSTSTRGSNSGRQGSPGISSPIHATDPVVLNDLQEEWDFLSRSACPVVQTNHEMWASPHTSTRLGFHTRNSRKTGGPGSSSTSSGTLSSSHLYSGVYGAEYLSLFTSDPAAGLDDFAAVTSISNGAN